eukprot:Phypoly_transcript_16056.p1 GENE.Phypoly_transcript_16056~~Phypoly_transcript_16056.p1  ORF type:complete len:281 (+),score=57.05 Phypoly_transcript_16056:70-843(+)
MTLVANAEDWNNVLEAKGVTVVDAYNSWFGPCTAIHPTFQRLQTHLQQNNLKLNFFLAETDKIDELKRYNVGAEPLFVIYMDGKVKETVGGGVNLPRILRTLSKYISPDSIFSFSPAQEAPPPPPFTPRGENAKPLLVTPRTAAAQAAAQAPPIQIMVPSFSSSSVVDVLMVPDFPDNASTTDTIDDVPSVSFAEPEETPKKSTLKSPSSTKKASAPKLSLSPSQTDHNQVSPRRENRTLTKQNSTKLKKSGSSGST